MILLLTATDSLRTAAVELSVAEQRFRMYLYDPEHHFANTDHYGDMVRCEEQFIDACRKSLVRLAGVEDLNL